MMTAELRRRLGPDSGIVAFAVHPGEVLTDVVRSLPPPLPKLYRWAFLHILLTVREGYACDPPPPASVHHEAIMHAVTMLVCLDRRGRAHVHQLEMPCADSSLPRCFVSTTAAGQPEDGALVKPPPSSTSLACAGARASVFCASAALAHLGDTASPETCYVDSSCRCVQPAKDVCQPAQTRALWDWSMQMTDAPRDALDAVL